MKPQGSINQASVINGASNRPWYTTPIDHRAHYNGEPGVNGQVYKAGEIMPFYIPRRVMPQIASGDYSDLELFAKEKGVKISHGIVGPHELVPHQRINLTTLHKQVEEEPASVLDHYAKKAVLISKDNYILDGNHRYWMHVWKGT